MGRRGKGWFRAFKKVFRPDSKHKKGQKSNKSNPERLEQPELFSSEILQSSALDAAPPPSLPLAPASKSDEGKFAEADLEQSKQVCSVTIPSSTEDPTNFNSSINVTVKSSEEGAAIKIQTAFRGYLVAEILRRATFPVNSSKLFLIFEVQLWLRID